MCKGQGSERQSGGMQGRCVVLLVQMVWVGAGGSEVGAEAEVMVEVAVGVKRTAGTAVAWVGMAETRCAG